MGLKSKTAKKLGLRPIRQGTYPVKQDLGRAHFSKHASMIGAEVIQGAAGGQKDSGIAWVPNISSMFCGSCAEPREVERLYDYNLMNPCGEPGLCGDFRWSLFKLR